MPFVVRFPKTHQREGWVSDRWLAVDVVNRRGGLSGLSLSRTPQGAFRWASLEDVVAFLLAEDASSWMPHVIEEVVR